MTSNHLVQYTMNYNSVIHSSSSSSSYPFIYGCQTQPYNTVAS